MAEAFPEVWSFSHPGEDIVPAEATFFRTRTFPYGCAAFAPEVYEITKPFSHSNTVKARSFFSVFLPPTFFPTSKMLAKQFPPPQDQKPILSFTEMRATTSLSPSFPFLPDFLPGTIRQI